MKTLLCVVALLLPLISASQAVPHAAAASVATAHFPVTIVDDHGFRVRLTKVPTRIVSLDARDTETLFAVGAERHVVADGSQYAEGAAGISGPFNYPSQWPSKLGRDYPVKSKSLPHIEGGCCGADFNLESVQSARPDVIFAPYSETELPTFQKMRDLGLKVVILDPANLKGIFHDISLVGRATGTEQGAGALIRTMQSELNVLSKRLKAVKSRPRVYYEVDATNPTQPYTVGRGTFIDEGIKRVRGKNIGDAIASCSGTTCYPQLSLESIVAQNPQVIALGDAQYGTTVDSVKARGGWDTISAVKSGRIYPFNDELISRAGPRFVIGLTALARIVHPEAFKKK